MSELHHVYFFVTPPVAPDSSKELVVRNVSASPVSSNVTGDNIVNPNDNITTDSKDDNLCEELDERSPYTGPWNQWWPAHLPTMTHKGKPIPKLELFQEIDILYEPDPLDIPWEFLVDKEFHPDGTKKSLTIMRLHFNDVEWRRPLKSLIFNYSISGMRGPCIEPRGEKFPDPCEIPIPKFVDGKYAGVGPSALERRELGLPHPPINPDYRPMSTSKNEDRSGELTLDEFRRFSREEGLQKKTWEELFYKECGWTPQSGKPAPTPRTTMVYDKMLRDGALLPHPLYIRADSPHLQEQLQPFKLARHTRQPFSPPHDSILSMNWRKSTFPEKVESPLTPPETPPTIPPTKASGAWRSVQAHSSRPEQSISPESNVDSVTNSSRGAGSWRSKEPEEPTKYTRVRSYADEERIDQIRSLKSWR
ncbi:hypothetical protein BP6252_03852 [Coleophoma cylindrospora]|uniref:Uncharacterized protein n=1 Tax=Coleophoma cylindrospora TaxID=1849047 RepID=A0A3D8S918_9HELO|nr:hypothetical protein BP6252_03852 [Coleophoma cylindrospora]